MSYEKYKDQLPHILTIVAQAGFQGVEAEVCMLGSLYEDAGRLREELDKNRLKLGALTLALPWLHPKETEEEKREADRLFDYLKRFPEALLILVPLPGPDRSHLAERQKHALRCVNAVAERAHERGIVSALHPNSPPGSVFRTSEDYKVMFDGMNTDVLGYCPDSGHIANGGMDVMELFAASRSIIKHVHFKDVSAGKQWKAMGEGVIDHPAVVKLLADSGYQGWVMVEEESKRAESEPDQVTIGNGSYVFNEL
jgi:inosose dehydratase